MKTENLKNKSSKW